MQRFLSRHEPINNLLHLHRDYVIGAKAVA
jgi:hypothetical protein